MRYGGSTPTVECSSRPRSSCAHSIERAVNFTGIVGSGRCRVAWGFQRTAFSTLARCQELFRLTASTRPRRGKPTYVKAWNDPRRRHLRPRAANARTIEKGEQMNGMMGGMMASMWVWLIVGALLIILLIVVISKLVRK